MTLELSLVVVPLDKVPLRALHELGAAVVLFLWIALNLGRRPWVSGTWLTSMGCGFVSALLLTQNPKIESIPGWFLPTAAVLAVSSLYFLMRTNVSTNDRQNDSLRPLTLVLIAAILVAVYSGEIGGAGYTRKFLIWIGTPAQSVDQMVFLIRKGVHLSFYAISGGMSAAAARLGRESKLTAARIGLLFALGLACFDEYRQSGATGRGSSLTDVGIDLVGASVGVLIACQIAGRNPQPRIVTERE